MIIGMPSSGKSTYLFALASEMPLALRQEQCEVDWKVGHSTPELDDLAKEFKKKCDKGGYSHTSKYTELPLFHVWRKRLSWVPGGVYHFVVRSPDVSGEWIRMLADGEEPDGEEPDSELPSDFEKFRSLLEQSQALIILIEWATEGDWQSTLEAQVRDFELLMKKLNHRRPGFRAVTIVFSKIDEMLKLDSRRGVFDLPKNMSYLAAWCQYPERGGAISRVDLAQELRDEACNNSPRFQHALAMDLLRAQAPRSAAIITSIGELPQVRLRVALGSSLGMLGTTQPLVCQNPINLFLPFHFCLDELSKVNGLRLSFWFLMVIALILWGAIGWEWIKWIVIWLAPLL